MDVTVEQDNKGLPVFKLRGVELCWSQLGSKKNELSDRYQVDICNLSDNQVAALKKNGIDVKEEDDEKISKLKEQGKDAYHRGSYITVKSSERYYRIFWPNKTELSIEEIDVIGNGTVVNVIVNSYDWQFKGKQGRSVGLQQMVIRNLVKYLGSEPDDDLFEDIETPDAANDSLEDMFE